MSFQIAVGCNLRKSPYFDATVADGVESFSVYNHMLIPAHFGDPDNEYRQLIENVVMWGRCRPAAGRAERPRRGGARSLSHAPRSPGHCRRPGKVRTHLCTRRHAHQRPGPAEDRRRSILAVDRGQRHPVMGRCYRGRTWPRRGRFRTRRFTPRRAGPAGRQRRCRLVRRLDPRAEILLVPGNHSRRHPDPARPLGLVETGRLRAVPSRR